MKISAPFVLYYSRDCRRAGRPPTGGGTRPVNPLPAKRIPAHIRSLCRAYTGEAVRSLAAIMRQADAPPKARLQAINILLDRGWGKPPQTRTGEDGETIRVIVRTITDGRGNGNGLTSTCHTTPVSDEPLAASQARRLFGPMRTMVILFGSQKSRAIIRRLRRTAGTPQLVLMSLGSLRFRVTRPALGQ